MDNFRELSRPARAYWALILLVGLAFAGTVLSRFDPAHQSLPALAIYVFASLAVAGFKIRLPGVLGTLSMNYVIILAALLDLDVASGLIVAITSTLGQCLLHALTKPRWFRVLFSVAGVPMPVVGAALALHSPALRTVDATGALPLLASSMAYFVLNTVTISGIIGLTTRESPWLVWKKSYLWTSPQYLVGGAIAGLIHLVNQHWGSGGLLLAGPPVYLLYRSYSTYLGRVREQQDHIGEMASLHLRTIETLALAIDAKDELTAAHLRRVRIYAAGIGRQLNLSRAELDALNAAALLHDVGKLAVPEYIVSKPGKLTPDEFEKMKVHPVVGAEILDRVRFPYPVVPIVRYHHEKYDGTGYPEGLSGEAIPIGARILSVVDCFDALTADRQYRKAMSNDAAMQFICEQSGKAFDPRIVELLRAGYRELEQRVQEEPVEASRLSTKVKIPHGSAPATGFAEPVTAGFIARPAATDFSRSIMNARREIQLLTDVISDLGNSLSLEDTLALLAVRLDRAVRYDAIAVYLMADGKLAPRFVKGESYRLFSSLEIPFGQGLSGWVAQNNAPIVNGNPAAEPGYLNDPRLVTALRSAISVPLVSERGTVGVLTLYALSAEAFTTDDRRLLMAVAPKAAHAIDNSLRFEQAAAAADKDELTGLANLRCLQAYLEAAIGASTAAEQDFSVIVMDLDGFKMANDYHGHVAGNRILQLTAMGLNGLVRAGDLVARLGGDEFVAVLAAPQARINDFLSRLDDFSNDLAAHTGCETPLSISSGLAVYPADGETVEALLDRADERMYETKRGKKLTRVA